MRILPALPAGNNLFPSPPSNPRINEPLPSHPPPPLPLPTRNPNPPSPPQTALLSVHNPTRHHKPVSPGTISSSSDATRSVLIGDSGLSYLLPGSPFEFHFSYSETPTAKPIALREPAFLPFAPPYMPRPWTGKAPLRSKKEKQRNRGIRLFEPLGENLSEGATKVLRMAGRPAELGRYVDGRSREEILGEPLKRDEAAAIVRPCLSSNRQVNLGEMDVF